MNDTQCVQWRPANIMQRIPIQETAHRNSTTTRHYQWEKKYKVKEVQNYRKWEHSIQFLVHWIRYEIEHNQWIVETVLLHAREAI